MKCIQQNKNKNILVHMQTVLYTVYYTSSYIINQGCNVHLIQMKVTRKVQVIISQFQQFRHKTNSSAFTNRRLIVLLLRYFATGTFSTIISFVNYAYRVIPDLWATSYFDIMEGIWPTHRRHVFVVRQVAAPGAKSAVSDCVLLMCVVKCLFVLIMCPYHVRVTHTGCCVDVYGENNQPVGLTVFPSAVVSTRELHLNYSCWCNVAEFCLVIKCNYTKFLWSFELYDSQRRPQLKSSLTSMYHEFKHPSCENSVEFFIEI